MGVRLWGGWWHACAWGRRPTHWVLSSCSKVTARLVAGAAVAVVGQVGASPPQIAQHAPPTPTATRCSLRQVLHRRANLTRPRIIHSLRAERLPGQDQYFVLHLRTQAGTYVKEFVHGERFEMGKSGRGGWWQGRGWGAKWGTGQEQGEGVSGSRGSPDGNWH